MRAPVRAAVVGLGYVGVPVAAAVAATGVHVVGVDIDPKKIHAINRGRNPLRGREPGLSELVKAQVAAKRLEATTDYAALRSADVVVVAVETPIDPVSHDPVYRALKAAIAGIGPHLKAGALVSIESTLSPGTMKKVVRPALERASGKQVGRDLHLVHCPERLTAGKLLHNLTALPRVLGVSDPRGARKARAFYARFVQGELHETDWTTAEVAKTAENAYWDVQIAFANEVALISEELGVDAYRVRELVNTCPYRAMLFPGTGVGGHCIPKDPWLLVQPAINTKPELIPIARSVNDYMPRRMVQLVDEALVASGRRLKGARVAVLGFAYREDTDDARNSPAIPIIRDLRRRGADVVIHDPYARTEHGFTILRDLEATVRKADAVAIVTAHTAYRKLDLKRLGRLLRRRVLVDGRNVFRGPEVIQAGFVYRGIGKGEF
ncbi:MAG TPA: nucleotide sugar dehydrogenase [Thermoplasmata archaeon]|nr:nucleotide sugar dehydrogenase [Thermoplasmata archaeon]